MGEYYTESLSANRLKRCYDIAPPRTQQYLKAEAQHVRSILTSQDIVLELGCGYGRFLEEILDSCRLIVGIDLSIANLQMAQQTLNRWSHVVFCQMNARTLGFPDAFFDVVLCVQNGISAFKIDPLLLIQESMRVTRPGGICIFSSYSDKFWEPRLEWFNLQSKEGLLGEIDWDATKDGVIVCKDGFMATTYRPQDFQELVDGLGAHHSIEEVDNSSIFCIIKT